MRTFLRGGRRTALTSLALLLVVGLAALGVYLWRSSSVPPRRAFSLIVPRYDTLTATVNATGQLEPAQVATLSFTSPGRVAEVLVRVGDQVAVGAALARLDARDLQLRVVQAEAALAQAQASYRRVADGATASERSVAEAQLQLASGQLRQAQGSVTPADVRAAEAQLAQAEAQLARIEAGPSAADLRAAEAQLAQAEASLQAQRNQLSAAKTNAELQVQQATNALTQAQSRYSVALQNWQHVQDTGTDPITPRVSDPSRPGQTKPNTLNDAQRQRYYDAFVQAEAALRSAEQAVQQALVAAESARQAEVSGIQAAERQVAVAQASLDQLRAGATAEQLAAARAHLGRLRGDQRTGALEAAQAGVAQAEANLARLQAGPQPSDLAVAEAQVFSAQAALDLAKLALEQATLSAPFAGVVAEVNLQAGEVPSQARAPLVLADLSTYHIDVTVDEIDVSRISAGQPVTLTLDALPDTALPGVVETISPLATANAAVTSYQVRVTTSAREPRLRAGMSANADIEVARRPNVLLAPRRAVRNDRGRLVVDLPRDQGLCGLPPEQRPAAPELEQREVKTGLSNEQLIEITGGLDDRTCVYVEGIDARLNLLFGPPPGPRR